MLAISSRQVTDAAHILMIAFRLPQGEDGEERDDIGKPFVKGSLIGK